MKGGPRAGDGEAAAAALLRVMRRSGPRWRRLLLRWLPVGRRASCGEGVDAPGEGLPQGGFGDEGRPEGGSGAGEGCSSTEGIGLEMPCRGVPEMTRRGSERGACAGCGGFEGALRA